MKINIQRTKVIKIRALLPISEQRDYVSLVFHQNIIPHLTTHPKAYYIELVFKPVYTIFSRQTEFKQKQAPPPPVMHTFCIHLEQLAEKQSSLK